MKYNYQSTKISIAILFSLSITLQGCYSQNGEDAMVLEMSQQKGYKDWYLDSFRCGLFVPPSYDPQKKYPLIIFLHGYSDTTTWNLGWYNDPIVSSDPCIVLTPKCPTTEIYRWGDSFDPRISPMMQQAYNMIDLARQAFNLDEDRFYIYGSSMGGIGTFGAIQKNPDMFAAGYVECARGNTDMASILAKIPFWMFHGSEDQIVPTQNSRDMYQAVLEAGGTQIRYTEYEGVGHNVWDYTGKETTIAPWLLAQRKGAVHGAPDYDMNFHAEINDQNRPLIEWDLPADNTIGDNQIWYVRIYRNDEMISEIYNDHTSYVDSLVNSATSYEYKISAVNYFFKESKKSTPISVMVE